MNDAALQLFLRYGIPPWPPACAEFLASCDTRARDLEDSKRTSAQSGKAGLTESEFRTQLVELETWREIESARLYRDIENHRAWAPTVDDWATLAFLQERENSILKFGNEAPSADSKGIDHAYYLYVYMNADVLIKRGFSSKADKYTAVADFINAAIKSGQYVPKGGNIAKTVRPSTIKTLVSTHGFADTKRREGLGFKLPFHVSYRMRAVADHLRLLDSLRDFKKSVERMGSVPAAKDHIRVVLPARRETNKAERSSGAE